MVKIITTETKTTRPEWAQEELDKHTMLVAGGHLERSEFPLPNAEGNNVVYAGILIGRTYDQREAGIGYGPVDLSTDDDGQIFLLVLDVDFDNDQIGFDGQCSLYRHGSVVAESSLPGWDSLDTTTRAKIRELYQTI